jgi:hypothetical protein
LSLRLQRKYPEFCKFFPIYGKVFYFYKMFRINKKIILNINNQLAFNKFGLSRCCSTQTKRPSLPESAEVVIIGRLNE